MNVRPMERIRIGYWRIALLSSCMRIWNAQVSDVVRSSDVLVGFVGALPGIGLACYFLGIFNCFGGGNEA